jgi:hypothetical protein
MYGGEDIRTWSALRDVRSASAPSARTTSEASK